MKYRIIALISTLALVLALAAPTRAGCPVASKEFEGPDGGDWNDRFNWEDDAIPDATDDVCIPDGIEVLIWAGWCDLDHDTPCDLSGSIPSPCEENGPCVANSVAASVCDGLEVQTGAGGAGWLDMTGYTELTVNGVALIDGILFDGRFSTLEFKSTVTLEEDADVRILREAVLILHDDVTIGSGATLNAWANQATIELASSLTITGDGGEIGTNIPYTPYAHIDSSPGGDKTLTLECETAGSPSTCVTLRGNWDINVPVVNNAYVLADDDVLTFKTAPVSGSGVWMADELSTVPGEIYMNVTVSGSAEWRLKDDADAQIGFFAASTGLTGDFNLELGTLEVNENVTTTGDLDMKSVSGSIPKIIVASGKKIIFGS